MTAAPLTLAGADADAADAAAGQSAIAPRSAEPAIMLSRPPRMAVLPVDQAAVRRIVSLLAHCPNFWREASSPAPATRMIQGKSDAIPDPAIGMDR
ncbi:hypothetical protein AB0B54_06920 [Microbispora bryophytorum]|uniref:hypothetical protein n=1 Tax=Microbispora bryophytorum TaxID=1460882 RepID=UPI0033E97A9C